MGRVRVRRVIRARAGYFTGLLLIGAGLFLSLGIGWALVALGVGTAAAFVWLYDVSEPSDEVVTRDDGGGWT